MPGQTAEVGAGLAENRAHHAVAVVTAAENRFGQRHEAPKQVECLLGVRWSHGANDRLALGFKIAGQRADALAVEERP